MALSDEPTRAERFLRDVRDSGKLPGDSAMRDLALALNLTIEGPDGAFRIHPLLDCSAADLAATQEEAMARASAPW